MPALDELLEYVTANRRVCPMPSAWNRLWELVRRRNKDGDWDPSLPRILGAWDSPALLKIMRLREQIEFASEHGKLEKVDAYLRGLPEEQWQHL